jgi:hypothetical protein
MEKKSIPDEIYMDWPSPPSSRGWNQGRFDTLAGPSEIQGLLKFRKRKLFGDNFVYPHAALSK